MIMIYNNIYNYSIFILNHCFVKKNIVQIYVCIYVFIYILYSIYNKKDILFTANSSLFYLSSINLISIIF